jgi:hypothetical protein
VAVGGGVGDDVGEGIVVDVGEGPGVLVGVGGTALGREQAEITVASPNRRINPSFRIATLYFLYRGVSML